MTAPGTVGQAKIKLGVDGGDLLGDMSKALAAALTKAQGQAAAGADEIGRALANVNTAGFESSMQHAARAASNVGSAAEQAMMTAAKAADRPSDAMFRLAEATRDAGHESDELGRKSRQAGQQAEDAAKRGESAFSGMKDAIAGIAAGIGIGEIIGASIDKANLPGRLQIQLGLTADEAAKAGTLAGDVFTAGFGDSLDTVSDAAAAVSGNISKIGTVSDETFKSMTESAIIFSENMGVEVGEASATAGLLLKNGLAKDGQEAFDLLFTASQKLGPQLAQEIPGLVDAYANGFRTVGFSGQDAFNLIASAASGGAEFMDHAGDAVKEFGGKLQELDQNQATALGKLVPNVENVYAAFRKGGPEAKAAFDQVVQALDSVENPAEKAQLAVQLFGDPITELGGRIPDFISKLAGGSNAMDGFAGAADRAKRANEGVSKSWDSAVRSALGFITTAITPIVNFFGNHPVAVQLLVGALGSLAVAYVVLRGAALASSIATGLSAGATERDTIAKSGNAVAAGALAVKTAVLRAAQVASTAAQWALNAAMSANPITLIVVAIAALVAGLAYFFTKTELGKKLWQGFVDLLGKGWEWIKAAFAAAWSFIKPILDGLWSLLQWMWASVISPIFTAIQVAIAIVATAFVLAWQIIQGIFNLWVALIQWVWGTILSPIFELLKAGFQLVGELFMWVWENLIKPAWDALGAGLQFVWDSIISPLWDLIKAGLSLLGDAFTWIWSNVIQPAWNALGDGINWVWTNVIQPAWEALKTALNVVGSIFSWVWNNVIKPAWDALGAGINWVWTNVIQPAWEAMKTGLNVLSGFFSNVVDGIGKAWDGLKRLLAKPINFLIGTVWNGGILKAWNKVAEFLPGIEPAKELSLIPEYRTGGRLSGPGTGTSDDILMWGSNNEHMVTAAEVIKAGGHDVIYAIRDMIKRGIPFEWDNGRLVNKLGKKNLTNYGKAVEAKGYGNVNPDGLFTLLPKFATGGAVQEQWMDQVARGHEFAQKWSGSPYVWGGSLGPDGGTDCSGYMSSIADVILGGNGLYRKWATGAFPGGGDSQGGDVNVGGQPWSGGLSQGFSIGVSSAHTAGTLSGAGNFGPSNVESGGAHGNVLYGGAGADDGQFPTRYHLPITNGAFESASDNVDPGIMKSFIKSAVSKVLGWGIDPVKGLLPKEPPKFLGIPGHFMDTGREDISTFLGDTVENISDGLWSIFKKAGKVIKDLVFDDGGVAHGTGVMHKNTIQPERVLSPSQTKSFDSLVSWLTGDSHDFSEFAHQLGEAFASECTPAMTQAVADGTKAGTASAAPMVSEHLAASAADAFETVADGLITTDAGLYDGRGTGLTDAELEQKRKEQWDALMQQLGMGEGGQQMGDSASSASGMSGSHTQTAPPPTSGTNSTTVHAPVHVQANNLSAEEIVDALGRVFLELIDN